jgi:arginyl-tRNA synthetase
MSAEVRAHLTDLLTRALVTVAPSESAASITLERPRDPAHGDYATNLAMQLARTLKAPPRKIAVDLLAALPASDWIAPPEIAGAGFINFRVKPAAKLRVVRRILEGGDTYGRSGRAQGRKVMVEFVSANPTGPLHVGHGRQAVLGDAIASLLEWQGWQVTREFYYNDAGQQIENLAISVRARAQELLGQPHAFPEDGYHGEYIRELARAYLDEVGHDLGDLDAIRKFAVAKLRAEQDEDLRALGVKFDNYYLESSLYTDGRVAGTVKRLAASGKTYEQDGALWLRTTDFGDDKDRVMRKSDGGYTYFVPDVAYHVTKWERGFGKVINVQGMDHHSTVVRVRAGLQALDLGVPPGYPDYVLHKMVTVMKGGEEVRISKRAGSYVTVRDLIDEVGRDAVRFFLVSRRADTEFAFDIDLASSQSEENPVYYVQYAHARVCSMFEQWKTKGFSDEETAALAEMRLLEGKAPGVLLEADLARLVEPRELALAARLGDFPDVLAAAADELAPHQVAFYLRELAGEFHSYYNAVHVLVPEQTLRRARLALSAAVRQAIANGLRVLGVSAPERM